MLLDSNAGSDQRPTALWRFDHHDSMTHPTDDAISSRKQAWTRELFNRCLTHHPTSMFNDAVEESCMLRGIRSTQSIAKNYQSVP
jgi:hypothetical protein